MDVCLELLLVTVKYSELCCFFHPSCAELAIKIKYLINWKNWYLDFI